MRFLLLAAAALAFAAPSRAQVSLIPMAGYDIDNKALQVGLAAELGVTPRILPFAASVRPSAEYVFVGDGVSLIRANGDLIGRFGVIGVPFRPYGKAGVGVEFASGGGSSNTEIGLNLGAGAEFSRLLAEVTLGIGDISSARIAVGYKF